MKNYNLNNTPREYDQCVTVMTRALYRLDDRQELLYPVLGDFRWDDQSIIHTASHLPERCDGKDLEQCAEFLRNLFWVAENWRSQAYGEVLARLINGNI